MKHFSLLFIFTLIPFYLFAANIKGEVKDENGKPLIFASVVIKGTQNGILSDADGFYQLQVPPGQYILVCRFTAYNSIEKKVVVTPSGLTVNFRMIPKKLSLKEVVVRGDAEDPAYEIMRKVIAKRKYHEKLVKTLETDIYLKGNLNVKNVKSLMGGIFSESMEDGLSKMALDSSGSGIIYLLEEASHYTFQSPDKEFTKIKSVHVSGHPQGLGFATMPSILNIYKNNIPLLGLNSRGFISPANDNAFHYYKFKYLGSFEQFARRIDKIQVIPKRKYEPLFTGIVYVAESDWVFQNVDLFLTKTAQISGLDTLRLTQTYEPYENNIWIIQNQALWIKLQALGVPIDGFFLTVYQNQKVNKPINKSVFSQKIISTYAADATKKDSSYWHSLRPVPIKEQELENFHIRDSVSKDEKAKADSAWLEPHYHLGFLAFLVGNPGIDYKNDHWSMQSLINSLHYNSVEGLNATLDLNWEHTSKDSAKTLRVNLSNRYGFQNHHFNSLLSVGMTYDDKHWKSRSFSWELSGGQYVYQFNESDPISPIMNEVYTLFSGKNYMKLFEDRLIALKLEHNWGKGFNAGMNLSYEQRFELYNTTDYSFRGEHDVAITSNLPSGRSFINGQKAALTHLWLSYRPGVHYIQYPEYKQPLYYGGWPTFSLDYTQAFRLGGAETDFAKWKAGLKQDIRLRMAGRIDYKASVGGFLRKKAVNFPDYNHINGNRTFLAGSYLNSFQLAPYYRFSNTADFYGEGHLEWHLNGFLTNKIPGFRKLNWFLVCGSNVLYINPNDYYAEVSVGLENIGWGLLRLGRLDFIAGYESGKAKPLLGLRIGLSLN